jgi:predicted nucleotidyltransferase
MRENAGMTAPLRPAASATPTLSELRARRDDILAVARDRGASDVRVFGSVARGTGSRTSDIDLLVSFESGRSLLDLGGLIADLEELLGLPVDVVTADELRPHVRERVLSDAVAL